MCVSLGYRHLAQRRGVCLSYYHIRLSEHIRPILRSKGKCDVKGENRRVSRLRSPVFFHNASRKGGKFHKWQVYVFQDPTLCHTFYALSPRRRCRMTLTTHHIIPHHLPPETLQRLSPSPYPSSHCEPRPHYPQQPRNHLRIPHPHRHSR